MSGRPLANSSKLDALLVRAFNAYRAGLCRQPPPQQQVPHRGFDTLRFLGTLGWMSNEQRLKLRRVHDACAKGLSAARNGNFDTAFIQYGHAEEYLGVLKDKMRLAWLLGASSYEAGFAYLDFRVGHFGQPYERLDRSMDADLELEKAGLPVMLMHRIQQGHNLARMDVRLGRRGAAVELAGVLLAYLEHRLDSLPYHHSWGLRPLQAVPRTLIREMILQIISETAGFIVTGSASASEWRDLIEASKLCEDPENAISPQVQFALRAQNDRLMNDLAEYLSDLEHFFRLGIRHCHLLWYALLIELVDFCDEIDTLGSRQVREVMLRDSVKWKGVPPFLRACLDKRIGGPRLRAVELRSVSGRMQGI